LNIITRILEKVFKLDPVDNSCQSCEHLRLLLEQERREKERLLSYLIQPKDEDKVEVQVTKDIPKPIKSRYVPWSIRARELEAQDRKEALLREQKETISLADLEAEMNLIDKEIKDASEISKTVSNDGSGQEGDEQHRAVS